MHTVHLLVASENTDLNWLDGIRDFSGFFVVGKKQFEFG